ncbi:plastocyanin/azurin family copper-binding protein [Trinickia sp. LjRoot230]|uniref:cupredoxin domain-containing protein n=1 Tax=Trinickia sp. LjRoot230 TaxID=3342288 RepID=UPI003ECC72C7
MNMNVNVQLVAAALALAVLTTPCAVRADTGHRFAFGAPANAAQVTKTIHVQATDQMRLVFDSEDIHRGDVVKFVVMNSGAAPHEFGIADEAGAAAHRQEMAAMPDMKHDDPNVISLAPGETKTLIWRFSGPRGEKLVFSCNVPGHYEAGMATRLTLK